MGPLRPRIVAALLLSAALLVATVFPAPVGVVATVAPVAGAAPSSCGGVPVPRERAPGPGSGIPLPVRIMPLGDSITIGMHGTGASWTANKSRRGGYRARLHELLVEAGVAHLMVGGSEAVDPREQLPCRDHEGHGGWCLTGGGGACRADRYVPGGDAGIAGRVAGWGERERPDVVLLHIGTNDVGAGRSVEGLAARYGDLLDHLSRLDPEVHVLVSALHVAGRPDVNVTFNRLLEALVARRVVAGARVAFVDTYAGAAAPVTGDDANGLHPSLATYEVMGVNWFEALRAHLPGLFPGPAHTAQASWR